MKFKRLNASDFAKENGLPYVVVDLLKQTSVSHLVDCLNGWSVDRTKKYVLRLVERLLDQMIVEDKGVKK